MRVSYHATRHAALRVESIEQMRRCLLATIGMSSVVRSSGQFHLGPEESRSDILVTKVYNMIATLHRRCNVYTGPYNNHRNCRRLADAGVF